MTQLTNSTNKLSFILFADDTNLFCSGKDIKKVESMVNDELTHVQESLILNQLTAELTLNEKNAILLCSNLIRNN